MIIDSLRKFSALCRYKNKYGMSSFSSVLWPKKIRPRTAKKLLLLASVPSFSHIHRCHHISHHDKSHRTETTSRSQSLDMSITTEPCFPLVYLSVFLTISVSPSLSIISDMRLGKEANERKEKRFGMLMPTEFSGALKK